jgi:hypothetical protein
MFNLKLKYQMRTLVLTCPHCRNKLPDSIGSQIEIALRQEFEKQKAQLEQELTLKIKEKENILDFITNKINTVTQSAAAFSISQRASGEAQEIFIEELVKAEFPTDHVQPVPKGVRGADCLITVRTGENQEIGNILVESKRTQTFVQGWTAKLKNDNLLLNSPAEILILVSKTLPKNASERFFVQDQLFICAPEEFKALYTILRYFLIKLQPFIAANKHREDRKDILYDFITSSVFRARIEGLYTSFLILQRNHFEEKQKLALFHKKREQELDKILNDLLETVGLIGNNSGVALFTEVINPPHLPQVD